MSNRTFALLLVVALAGFGTRSALANPVGGLDPPQFDVNGTPLDLGALNCESRDGLIFCGVENLEGDGYLLDLSLALNPDPSVSGNFSITNTNAATQTFVLTMTLAIAPIGPALSITGSIGAGTLTDLSADGATLTDDGSSIYTARIDGSPVRTLLDPPQSYTAPADPFGAPSSVPIPMASFGPEFVAQAANSTISMRFEFTLSGHDNVELPILFAVQPVPEPGTSMLLGAGLAGLVLFGRSGRG